MSCQSNDLQQEIYCKIVWDKVQWFVKDPHYDNCWKNYSLYFSSKVIINLNCKNPKHTGWPYWTMLNVYVSGFYYSQFCNHFSRKKQMHFTIYGLVRKIKLLRNCLFLLHHDMCFWPTFYLTSWCVFSIQELKKTTYFVDLFWISENDF